MEWKYTHVIWDFNGTLYDDVAAGIESANRLLRAHGLKPFSTAEEYRATFGFPIIDYYRRMGFDFEKTPYDLLAREWVPYYMEASAGAAVYPEAIPLLELFSRRGCAQILLSATEYQMLCGQVAQLKLDGYFEEILGQDNIHAHGKTAIACEWREKNPTARVLLIGDTLHDAEVANAMGADCVLLACGHQPREKLLCADCLAVYDSHALFYVDLTTSQTSCFS